MTDLPVVPPAAPQEVPGDPGSSDEILVAFAGPAKQNRLTVLVRIVLAIPHFIVLWALGIATEVVVVISWFAALFTGRVPTGLAGFMAGYLRWSTRVNAYLLLLTDEYPPFELGDSDYPVHVAVRPGRLNRLAVFLRIILAIPAWLISIALIYGLGTIAIFIIWLIVLISGRMSETLYGAIAAIVRYFTRFYGYGLLLTGTYPKGLFGDEPGQDGTAPAWATLAAGPASGPGLSPGYGQPGFGQPASGQPGFGQPAYGQPGYVQPPAGAQPGYVQPAYTPPVSAAPRWPVGDLQAWRLVLSSGAKTLVGVFLALGALLVVGYVVVVIVAASNSTSTNAILTLDGSHATLNNALDSVKSKTAACHGTLSCGTAQDARAAQAFGAFAQAVHGTPMPAGPATAAANRVYSDATQVQNDYLELAKSTSISQYQQTLASIGLDQQVAQFNTDYQNLWTALGAG